MSETNSSNLDRNNESSLLTKLPVDISPEHSQEVGVFLEDILSSHGTEGTGLQRTRRGHPYKIPIEIAEFITGDKRITVTKAKNSPDITISQYEKTKSSDDKTKSRKWSLGPFFTYKSDENKLVYMHGESFFFSYAPPGQVLKPGVEGVQRTGRRGGFTINVTPPTPEGVTHTLSELLDTTEELATKSKRPIGRIKRLGRKIVSKVSIDN